MSMKAIEHIIEAIEADPELQAALDAAGTREERALILQNRGIEVPDPETIDVDMLTVTGGSTASTTAGTSAANAV
jgi:hypothetical protein